MYLFSTLIIKFEKLIKVLEISLTWAIRPERSYGMTRVVCPSVTFFEHGVMKKTADLKRSVV